MKDMLESIYGTTFAASFAEVVFIIAEARKITPDDVIGDDQERRFCGAVASRVAAAAVTTWKEINAERAPDPASLGFCARADQRSEYREVTGKDVGTPPRPRRTGSSFTPSFQDGEDV
jgi:hypothetical protein